MLADGLSPRVAQDRVILVEAVNAGGAKRARPRWDVAGSDQLGDCVANELVAALPKTALVGVSLRLVTRGEFPTLLREPFAQGIETNLPALGELRRRQNAGLTQHSGESAANRLPALRIVAPKGPGRTSQIELGPWPSRQACRRPSRAEDSSVWGKGNLDRIDAEAHAYGEKRTQAQRTLSLTRSLESRAWEPQVLGKRGEATPGKPGANGLDERSGEADRTGVFGSGVLVGQHLMDGERHPPIPMRITVRIRTTGGYAPGPLDTSKIRTATLARTNRSRLRDDTLRSPTHEASLGQRHLVMRTPAHGRNTPQERLPELEPSVAPVGEAAWTPSLAGTQDDSSTAGREQQSPRQEGMEPQVRAVGQILEGTNEVLGTRPETVEIDAVMGEVEGEAGTRK